MSTYELEDHEVEMILSDLRRHGSGIAKEIADRIEAQIPIPAPTKIGAVVRTKNATGSISVGTFLRWATDPQTVEPWICVGDRDLTTYRSDDIGRITEVLSEGVDL